MVNNLDVLVANRPGKVVSVPYSIDEPIFFLIKRVARKLKELDTDFHCQDLYLNGIHLEYPQQSLNAYRVLGGCLTYQSTKKGGMSIFVKTFSGKSLTLPCDPTFSIKMLKHIITRREGVPQDKQRLLFSGQGLEDEKTLDDYGITGDSTVHLTASLQGGKGIAGAMFADITNKDGVLKVELAASAPPGRIVSPGANIECNCECTPSYRVICQVKFGTIELSQAQLCCPNCEQTSKVVPVTVGFLRCKYRFHGIKLTGEQYTSTWTDVARKDQYQLFDPDQQTTWARLVIETVCLDAKENCAICLRAMHSERILLCGHRFHSRCHPRRSLCPSCSFNQFLQTGRKALRGGWSSRSPY